LVWEKAKMRIKKGGREMQETYLFLNKESPEKMKVFIKLLWQSHIPMQYATIEPDKKISIDDYLAEMKKKDIRNRLIIGQEFSSGKLIRFLSVNDRGEKAQFCCPYNSQNAKETEKLFKTVFGYNFTNYPNQEINTPQQR